LDAESAERIKTLIGEAIDWDYLFQIAQPHGLIPLVYWNLNRTCPEAVPIAALRRLRRYFRANASWNLRLTADLLKLLDLLKSHGVPCLPFKGPVLIASAYGELGLRESRDLDVFVHRRDVLRATAILTANGYQQLHEDFEPDQKVAERFFLYNHVFQHGTTRVEMHWTIAERQFAFPLDPESLWDGIETVSLSGRPVPSLRPETLLLCLCAHGARHRWDRLMWICDVAEFVRVYPRINWKQLLAWAETLGGQRLLLLGLGLAKQLLAATLPKDVSERIEADPAIEALVWDVQERLFRDLGVPGSRWERWHFYLRVRERLADRIRCCQRIGTIPDGVDRSVLPWAARFYILIAILFTPNVPDWVYISLPARLSFLYFLIRPIRLFDKFVLRRIGVLWPFRQKQKATPEEKGRAAQSSVKTE
jgi:hypothetical protein